MVGDFNGISDKAINSTSKSLQPPLQLLALLCKCIQHMTLLSCIRERDYTFYSTVHKSFSRIHMFLVDQQSLRCADKCEIGIISWLDHAPIHSTQRFPFMWKNNTVLFANPENKIFISDKLTDFFSTNATTTQSSFTTHKAYMRRILNQSAIL